MLPATELVQEKDRRAPPEESTSEAPPNRSGTVTTILTELQRGQQWLDRHHELWKHGDLGGASDAIFSRILDEWDERDRVLRNLFAFEGCIGGEGQHCPDENVADCGGCAK